MCKDNTIVEIHYDRESHTMYSLDYTSLKMYSRHKDLPGSRYFLLLLGGSVFFYMVIFPNIREWFESQGLNQLPIDYRTYLVIAGFLMGIIVFVIGRKTPMRNTLLTKEEYFEKYPQTKEIEHSTEVIELASRRKIEDSTLIIAIFILGAFILGSFWVNSNFHGFVLGVVFIVLGGMRAINFKSAILTVKVPIRLRQSRRSSVASAILKSGKEVSREFYKYHKRKSK